MLAGSDLCISISVGCCRQRTVGKKREEMKSKRKSGCGLSVCKTHLWVLLLCTFCFNAAAQERVSHQHDGVSLADVPILPVSPEREGNVCSFDVFREAQSGKCAWLGCVRGAGKRWLGILGCCAAEKHYVLLSPKHGIESIPRAWRSSLGVDGDITLSQGSLRGSGKKAWLPEARVRIVFLASLFDPSPDVACLLLASLVLM